MQTRIKVMDYSCYNDWVITDKGENWSSVVTKLVQLAGRYCERFASDITYDINSFTQSIEEHKDFDRYLFFREMGVTALKPIDLDAIANTEYIQVWHLTYNAETEVQELKRVRIHFERVW